MVLMIYVPIISGPVFISLVAQINLLPNVEGWLSAKVMLVGYNHFTMDQQITMVVSFLKLCIMSYFH